MLRTISKNSTRHCNVCSRLQISNSNDSLYFNSKLIQIRNSSHQVPNPQSNSGTKPIRQKTLTDINRLYKKGEKISVVTVHDYITAKWVNDSKNIDIALIGDSLANTTKGLKTTLELDFEDYYYSCKSIVRAIDSKFLIADLPFGSFESSLSKCIESSVRLMKLGKIGSIKIEGCYEYESEIKRLIQIGVPVTSHIGLKPQRVNSMGGYKIQGKSMETALDIYKEAKFLQDLGVSMIVLECVPEKLSKFITDSLSIPTIGIGAGEGTSGQVLVQSDLLGMLDGKNAKFVKGYNNLYQESVNSLDLYGDEVKNGVFPKNEEHGFEIKDEEFNEFIKIVNKS